MISGLLTSYSFYKQLERTKRLDIPREYVSRLMRYSTQFCVKYVSRLMSYSTQLFVKYVSRLMRYSTQFCVKYVSRLMRYSTQFCVKYVSRLMRYSTQFCVKYVSRLMRYITQFCGKMALVETVSTNCSPYIGQNSSADEINLCANCFTLKDQMQVITAELKSAQLIISML